MPQLQLKPQPRFRDASLESSSTAAADLQLLSVPRNLASLPSKHLLLEPLEERSVLSV